MTEIQMGATVYVSMVDTGFQPIATPNLSEILLWVNSNVDKLNCRYIVWGPGHVEPWLEGMYLYPEQATIFKLKFGL